MDGGDAHAQAHVVVYGHLSSYDESMRPSKRKSMNVYMVYMGESNGLMYFRYTHLCSTSHIDARYRNQSDSGTMVIL